MTSIDESKLDVLRAELAAREPALREKLAEVSSEQPRPARKKRKALTIPESYELVVTCRDEQDQRQVYERLMVEGYACRVLTL